MQAMPTYLEHIYLIPGDIQLTTLGQQSSLEASS